MTNIQLLLLATNNIKNNTELSHSQESYVYQYYYTNLTEKHPSVEVFMKEFIKLTSTALHSDPEVKMLSSQIYSAIESYLEIAQARYIQRQKLLKTS